MAHPQHTGSSGTGNAGAGHHGGSSHHPPTSNNSSSNLPTTVATGHTKAPRRSSGKSSHSRSYPRGVGLDFRKLAGLTLVSYIDHHGVQVRPEAPPSELAVAVARHFEQMEVEEEECIGGFLERLEAGGLSSSFGTNGGAGGYYSTSGGGGAGVGGSGGGGFTTSSGYGGGLTEYARKTAHFDGRAAPASVRKSKRNKWAARPGEQVAAKVTRTDENGSWILATVQRFYADTETYDVQDDDDTSKLIRLPWSHVMRLSTGTEGCFPKGADCMAIFPETTSFYKATVSKSPVWKLDRQTAVPTVMELIVKFEDDEDTQGKTPHRRVPSRYVIPIPQHYFYDDSDDVDLTPPGTTPK